MHGPRYTGTLSPINLAFRVSEACWESSRAHWRNTTKRARIARGNQASLELAFATGTMDFVHLKRGIALLRSARLRRGFEDLPRVELNSLAGFFYRDMARCHAGWKCCRSADASQPWGGAVQLARRITMRSRTPGRR